MQCNTKRCILCTQARFSHARSHILSGFKKCGIHPLNPGKMSDQQLAPSKPVHVACTYHLECVSLPETTAGDEGHGSISTNSLHGSTSTLCSSDSSNKIFTFNQECIFNLIQKHPECKKGVAKSC